MDQKSVFIKMALSAWHVYLDRCTQILAKLSDEQWMKEIAPGKNRGIYLAGHLAAIHDEMSMFLGTGKPEYPELKKVFVEAPDKSIEIIPSVADVRSAWAAIHERLSKEFASLTPEDWFKRHEAMSDHEFEKDPSRNKLNVVMNRTNHLSYHLGQIRMLK